MDEESSNLIIEAIYRALDEGYDESTVGEVVEAAFKSWEPVD